MAGQLNGSVLTAFSILSLLTESRPTITTQDVSRELDMNTVTAYRFLRSLEVAGALVAVQRGQYRLGLALADFGERATATDTVSAYLQPYLNELAQDLQETALATMYRYGRIVIVARAVSPRPYAMSLPVGSTLEAHCTANGKLWLASLRPQELEHYMATADRKSFTPQTITTSDDLFEEIERVKKRGYAICIREREEEISAVAAPVKMHSSGMVAGISLFGPSWRFTQGFIDKAADRLHQVTEDVVHGLYGRH